MYELINTDHMHLELNVYENAIAGVKKGQSILFSVPSLGGERYQGEVFLVGKSFDMEPKTVKVHGHFNDMKHQFRSGLSVEAAITRKSVVLGKSVSVRVSLGGGGNISKKKK